jgi:hypothetical protein
MTSTTKELLAIGVVCGALLVTLWPIVEYLK